ncbi:MAG: S1 RNA-binding domain-containing protein [Clostridia bacterium]|nr:S1 RNA-binding domain-containing protein [Clostridia bacterium]
MISKKITPEGWSDKTSVLNLENIEEYIEKKQTLQGIVEECDSGYNLYVNLGNNLKGMIPREEVEAINIGNDGLPKTNLCTGKVNKYVQFKIKEVKNNNLILLSRKDVQNEAIQWVKKDLRPGDYVTRNS